LTIIRQKTLGNQINCTGIGLHSGAKVTMTLHPAPADTGIRFLRTDLPGSTPVLARYDQVSDTMLCTTIEGDDGAKVATIEHLMAALAGCGVDNALVELDGPEVPVMDGSSAPFVFLIECASLVEQDAPRRWIRVLKPVSIRDGERTVSLTPGNGFSVSFEIDFAGTLVSKQSYFADLRDGTFKTDLCRARTFGFASDADKLRSLGLALGGSLDNAVVVDNDQVLNEEGLRYDDEFVRHKVLDSIGDLYLAGGPIQGHFTGERSGHSLNNQLLKTLFDDEASWCYTTEPPEAVELGATWGSAAAAASA
jgi:UDP-3-O-[3-hydroxymyristoyl] N-acetylglucosamine deacetylase